jgi:hypothetical protein
LLIRKPLEAMLNGSLIDNVKKIGGRTRALRLGRSGPTLGE